MMIVLLCMVQVSATGDTTARARIVAKYLEAVGRTDIAVGVGMANSNSSTNNPLYDWASDYDLTKCALPLSVPAFLSPFLSLSLLPTSLSLSLSHTHTRIHIRARLSPLLLSLSLALQLAVAPQWPGHDGLCPSLLSDTPARCTPTASAP
jgi:hypothetical protein